jgi:hypothetical protein
MAKVDETRLDHATVVVGAATVLFSVSAVVVQRAPLQQFAAMGQVTLLVTPAALVGHPTIVSNPGLPDKPLPF